MAALDPISIDRFGKFVFCPMVILPVVVSMTGVIMLDVVIEEVALIELALKVEYAATPGVPLLILETVRVDKTSELVVMVDPVSVE